MKNLVTILFILTISIGMAQEQLNDYKYIIVPKQFEDFKRQNQYQTSTLMKHLFTEKGFDAIYEDELPNELNNNRCLGLKAKLLDNSSMFTTKASVMLENCNGQEVFITKEGKSKEKDYKDSYGEALRDAFASFDSMDYAYNGKAGKSGPITVNMQNDVKNMDEDSSRARQTNPNRSPLVEQEATRENQRYVDRRPVESNLEKAEAGTTAVETSQGRKYANPEALKNKQDESQTLQNIASATLYAQELPNGYQLVDSTPKIRMKIHKTSMADFYLAESGSVTGVVFQKNGTWFLEYYDGDKLMTEELNIKF